VDYLARRREKHPPPSASRDSPVREDPFANPQETLETLRLIREEHPDLMLCVATNGLNLLGYLDDVASLRVSLMWTVTLKRGRSRHRGPDLFLGQVS
jgi:hypothetical protein